MICMTDYDFYMNYTYEDFPSLESLSEDISTEDESPSVVVKIIEFIKLVFSYIVDIAKKVFKTVLRGINFLVLYFTSDTHKDNVKDFTKVLDYIIRVKTETSNEDALKLFLEVNEKSFKYMHISLLMLDGLNTINDTKESLDIIKDVKYLVNSKNLRDEEFLVVVQALVSKVFLTTKTMKSGAKKRRKMFMVKELGTDNGKYCELSSESWNKIRELNVKISARNETIYNLIKRINDVGRRIILELETRMDAAYERLEKLKQSSHVGSYSYEIRQKQRETAAIYNNMLRTYNDFSKLLNARSVGYGYTLQLYDKHLCKIIKSLRKMLFS